MPLTRRQFLKLTSLSALAMAFRPLDRPLPPEDQPSSEIGLGRVIAPRVTIRSEPSSKAKPVRYRYEDQIVNLRSVLESDGLPEHNRWWYEVAGGYVHSGWIQTVRYGFQNPLTEFPGQGFIAEVSVPFTDSRAAANPHSARGYRFYFGTTHWVTAIRFDEWGGAWYRVWDDKWKTRSYVLGRHLRPIPEAELAPISPDVVDKRIEVDTENQWATAYESGRIVFMARVATGDWIQAKGVWKDFTTPTGTHAIERKTPSRHMAAGDLAAGDGYDLPGVPWVSYFTTSGVAFPGTYWHNDFGRPRSHGCVNMPTEAAKWIYRWTLPHAPASERYVWETGTRVIVV